jgi:hypothetical protein
MNLSLIWNLLAVGASGSAVYVMDWCPLLSVLLAGLAGLIIGLTSRFDVGVTSAPDPKPDAPP